MNKKLIAAAVIAPVAAQAESEFYGSIRNVIDIGRRFILKTMPNQPLTSTMALALDSKATDLGNGMTASDGQYEFGKWDDKPAFKLQRRW